MPTYMFTYLKRGNGEVPIVRIEADTEAETKLEVGKHQSIVIEQPDIIYAYEFVVKNPIKTEFNGEHYYQWYQLEYLSKSIDRSPAVKTQAEQIAANLDYLSMMTDIDIPTEEPQEVTPDE